MERRSGWTTAHVVADEDNKMAGLYSLSVYLTNETLDVTTSDPPALLDKFRPHLRRAFATRQRQACGPVLVFSDNVYEGGDPTKVPENDGKWRSCCPCVRRYVGVTLGHVHRASLFSVRVFMDGEKH
jgi:hypothetical protein